MGNHVKPLITTNNHDNHALSIGNHVKPLTDNHALSTDNHDNYALFTDKHWRSYKTTDNLAITANNHNHKTTPN